MVDGSCQGERVILSLLRLAGLEAGAFDDRQARISRVAGVAIGHPAPDELAPAVIDHARGVPASAAQARRRRRLPGRRDMVHHGGMFTSEATTRGVRVEVVSEFSPARSRVHEHQWFFLYTITITNDGDEPVQLVSRHWIITDDAGHVEEVRGPGVVGEQPVLAPNESYTYTSGCPLSTPSGIMEGAYQMVTRSGEEFDAKIAPFTLSQPYTVH